MKKFFIGMLFIFLNFNLTFNGHIVGLLPKFVGYWFVLKGIESFNSEVPAFEKVKQLCKIMIVVHTVFYIFNLLAITLYSIAVVLNFASLAAALYITFNITEGILYLENSKNIFLEGENLRDKWKMFCILICAATVLVYVPLVNIIAIIANAVCSILFLVQFNKTKNLGIYYGL